MFCLSMLINSTILLLLLQLLTGQTRWRYEHFYDRERTSSILRCFCLCRFFLNSSFFMLIFDIVHVSAPNMVLFWRNFSHRWKFWLTSSFLHFILVICFMWEALASIHFLLHVVNWFHCLLFNIIYVKHDFVVKMSFLFFLV